MTQQNMFTRDFVEAARQQAEMAEGHDRNVKLFAEMFLSLGPDVLKLTGTAHDEELMEARGLAAHRWSRLFDLEAQVQRDEQNLVARPKKRPAQHGDDMLANEVIKRLETAFAAETDGMRSAFAELKEQTKRERKELESLKRR